MQQEYGYDVAFEKNLEEKYVCPLCHKALRNPLQTQCGHRFCEKCLEPLLRQSHPRCPVDGQELNPAEIFLDRCCEREVLSLGCLCYNHTRGCQWNGELRYVQEHEEECLYSVTRCTNAGCIGLVEKRHLEDHVNNKCPHWLDTCKLCDAEVKRCEMEEHLHHCPKVVMQCTMGCGAQITRDTLNEHAFTVCPNDAVPCSLAQQEATSYDGVYIWKITDWTSRLNEAVTGKTPSIYSPPFYVGRFGYKMCARLYPNGDGIGKGTHLSLFFVVMRGEYDALLSWPFRQEVTFSLLDQDGYRNITDTFRPDPNSLSFKRPTSAMNIASGSPQFVSHQNLQSRRYIKDDTMFVKITVDRTGMVDL